MKLYMLVTNDEYELPLAVADSIPELARIIGKSNGAIWSAISYAKKKGHNSIYKEVEYDEQSY